MMNQGPNQAGYIIGAVLRPLTLQPQRQECLLDRVRRQLLVAKDLAGKTVRVGSVMLMRGNDIEATRLDLLRIPGGHQFDPR
jgi:hypothetical protein